MVGHFWCQLCCKRGLKPATTLGIEMVPYGNRNGPLWESKWSLNVVAGFSPRLPLRILPDFAGCVDHKLKLPPLFVFAQKIALHRRSKPALRAQRKILERHVAARFLDALDELVLGFDRDLRAAGETEDE